MKTTQDKVERDKIILNAYRKRVKIIKVNANQQFEAILEVKTIQIQHYIGAYVFPIVKMISKPGGKPVPQGVLGTGFLIGNEGYFLTANHVLSEATLNELTENEKIFAFLTNDDVINTNWEPQPISSGNVENAPFNYDLSIGKINHNPKLFFALGDESNSFGWDNIKSIGYPVAQQFSDQEDKLGNKLFKFAPLFLKGYIARKTDKGENIETLKNCPPGYVLSYPLLKGMSGAPIVKDEGKGIIPGAKITGVCLASFGSKAELYEIINYKEKNGDKEKQIIETANRVVEYGFGIDLYSMKDWKVRIAQNRSLEEIFTGIK